MCLCVPYGVRAKCELHYENVFDNKKHACHSTIIVFDKNTKIDSTIDVFCNQNIIVVIIRIISAAIAVVINVVTRISSSIAIIIYLLDDACHTLGPHSHQAHGLNRSERIP